MEDGAVIISTKIDNSGIEKGKRDIESSMKGLRGTFDKAFGGKALERTTRQMRDIQMEIDAVKQKMVEVETRKAGIDGFGKKFENAQTRIKQTEFELGELNKQMESIGSQKAAERAEFYPDKAALDAAVAGALEGDKAYQKLGARYDALLIKLQKQKIAAGAAKDEAIASAGKQSREYKDLEKQMDRLLLKQQKLNSRMADSKKSGAITRNAFKKMGSAALPCAKSILRLSNILKLMIIRTVLRAGIRAVQNGFRDLAKSSATVQAKMSEASTALLYMRNALTSAVAPAVMAVIPWITRFADAFARAANAIAAFTARLFGNATMFSKAKKAVTSYGDAAGKAAGKLAGFDDLDVLQQDSGTGGPAPGDMFEDVEIPDNIRNFADKIREILPDIKQLAIDVGAAFLAWRIASVFTKDLKTIFGILLLVFGLTDMIQNVKKAFTEGNTWESFFKILGDGAIVVGGLFLLFSKFNLGPIGAAIGMLVTGIGLLITGVKGLLEGDLSLQTLLTVLTGIALVALAIGILFGAIPAIIAAVVLAIGALVVIIVKHWDEIKAWLAEAWAKIKKWFSDAVKWIKDKVITPICDAWAVFKQWISDLWAGIVDGIKGAINGIISFVNGMISAVCNGINWVIRGLNKLSFDVPDWACKLIGLPAGTRWGFNISEVKAPQIPLLAQGAVIPPNREFLAVLGDQKSGTNIEAPLDTILQAFRMALAENGGGRGGDIILQIDGKTLARIAKPYLDGEGARRGVKLVTGGAF